MMSHDISLGMCNLLSNTMVGKHVGFRMWYDARHIKEYNVITFAVRVDANNRSRSTGEGGGRDVYLTILLNPI